MTIICTRVIRTIADLREFCDAVEETSRTRSWQLELSVPLEMYLTRLVATRTPVLPRHSLGHRRPRGRGRDRGGDGGRRRRHDRASLMEALLFVIAGCILLGWGPRVLLACILIPIVIGGLALLTADQRSQYAASPAEAQSRWLEQYCADQKRRGPTFRERYPSSAPQIRCDP